MTIALDISHFTEENSGLLTFQQLEDAWNQGVRGFKISIANQAIAVRQIDAIVDHPRDFWISTYRYYYFGMGTIAAQTDKAFIQRVRDLKYNIQLHAIDIEDTNPNFTAAERIKINHQLIEQFENFCPTEEYTAEWFWETYMANTIEFNFMPLWYAWWPKDKQPRLNIPEPRQFGGWTIAKTHQFIGESFFAGIWCDVNYYEDFPLPINPPEQTIIDGVYTEIYHNDKGQVIEIKNHIVRPN